MARFKPSAPFTQALVLLIPKIERIHGTNVKKYPAIAEAIDDGRIFNGNFKTYGGTDRTVNGIYSIEDTAIVETWYRPDITSECAVAIPETGEIYEITGVPEDIERRHQYLRIRVTAYKGNA